MRIIDRARIYSPWIYHLHCGGCNGCDIEILAALSPRFDVERFGIMLVSSPRHADVLLTTGPVPKQFMPMLKRVYSQIPEPKVVVAVGSCASGGSLFYDDSPENYAIVGSVDRVIPVDVYIPGCPPKPEAIINGIVQAIIKLVNKANSPKNAKKS